MTVLLCSLACQQDTKDAHHVAETLFALQLDVLLAANRLVACPKTI